MQQKIHNQPITHANIFINEQDIADIHSGKYSVWRPSQQPVWSADKIAFGEKANYRRRHLIRALTAPSASLELKAIGCQIYNCVGEAKKYGTHTIQPCHSPLCDYCRTRNQDVYQKRVLKYFGSEQPKDLCWITILDDMTYDPVADIPKWREPFKKKIKRVFDGDAVLKRSKMFGALEIDVKKPKISANKTQAIEVLRHYGLKNPDDIAFMPHYHAIVALDGASIADLRAALKQSFKKRNQVLISPLWKSQSLEDNLAYLARYMFKFRYQFADNIMNAKPRYDSRFDDEIIRVYAQVIYDMKGERGLRSFEMKYNL